MCTDPVDGEGPVCPADLRHPVNRTDRMGPKVELLEPLAALVHPARSVESADLADSVDPVEWVVATWQPAEWGDPRHRGLRPPYR